jgi:hypothetical protein
MDALSQATQVTPAVPVDAGSNWAIWAAAIAVGVLALFVLYIRWRTKRLPGEYVYQASRLTRGNRLFPAQVQISPSSVTMLQPQWVGKLEESVHIAHIASIKIDTNMVFSDVLIETTGGHNPMVCHGHTKSDAVKMKQVIEKFQSEYYKKP